MGTRSTDLISLVEKLRQEQEFVSFYKSQIRQGVQELNVCCDNVFHTLWLCHTLSYGLRKVLAHQIHCYEWSHALHQVRTIQFVNATKVIKSHIFVEKYSKFLSVLLNDPGLVSEILQKAELEGLDCNWLMSDLMSVVYGNCVFQRDHTLFLQLLKELLTLHIQRCDSPKDLFSGVESVFNKALSEYCAQLVDLRTFLTEVLREPLMKVVACREHLEYDVNKAGSRFQENMEQKTFLFSEDLDSSCNQLAQLAMGFLENLNEFKHQFPLSLKWLLGTIKSQVHHKWPEISNSELRRPISDAIFGSILSAVIVNPDSYGVMDSGIVIGPVARYNLTQITSVLQGCAWILGKSSSSKYPIHKVIKRMNVDLFYSLIDTIDGGYSKEIPDIPSYLPGLKRSAYLTSQAQLDSLVGLVALIIADRVGSGSFHHRVSDLLNYLPKVVVDQACKNPYNISSNPPTLNRAPTPGTSSTISTRISKRSSLDGSKVHSTGLKRIKRGSSSTVQFGDAPSSFSRSKTMSSVSESRTPKGAPSGSEMKLNTSSSSPLHEGNFCLELSFQLPGEVLIVPIFEQSGDLPQSAQWDFDLLSEEEFMAHRTPPKTEDCRLLELELSPNIRPPTPTPPEESTTMAPSPAQEEASPSSLTPSPTKAKGKGSPLKLKFRPPGKVREMISKIERSRSHTLPTSPRSPKTPSSYSRLKGFKSEGGTPQLDASPTRRLGMLRSYAVPVKGDDGDGDTASKNHFIGSTSLPDLEPGFFDRAMNSKNGDASAVNGDENAPTPTSAASAVVTTPSSRQASSNHSFPEATAATTTLHPQPDQRRDITTADTLVPPPHHRPPPSTRAFNGETTVVEANDDDLAGFDPFSATTATPIGSVKSVEGYIKMDLTKSSITDSGGYVKMQPALLASYAPSNSKSPLSVATTSPVYAVGESSSNNSDAEQNVVDMNSKLLSPDSASSLRNSPDLPSSDHGSDHDHGSMENLYEQDDDCDSIEGRSKRKGRRTFRINKKIKKLFKRHKPIESAPRSSASEKGRSISPASSTSTLPSSRKPRSVSNVEQVKVKISEENNGERELSPTSPTKPRSASQNDVLDDVPGYPVKRSYTMLTDHITKKYQKKVLDKIRADSSGSGGMSEASSTLSPVKESLREEEDGGSVQNGGGREGVDFLTPPSKMSPLRYRRSLYCDQLKYKLRAALQNIHTPLSLSPIYLQLCVDDDAKCDSRYQLILLIQHALQRSRWRHDVMEIALLTELLKMIEPLPNELAQATLEGVYEEYNKRSAYIAYLVKSQQKFQDAKLQVAAIQTSVDRLMEIEEELFVNFSVRSFLEGQEADVQQFTHQLENLQLADEKVSTMEGQLATLGQALVEENTWQSWSDVDGVLMNLEDQLFAQVYDLTFHPNRDTDMMRDQIFSDHLTKLSDSISVSHKSLLIPQVYHSGCPWVSAQKHLINMALYKSPRGKLRCIVKSCKVLISLLQYAKCGDPPGADDLFPVLVYVLIKSNPAGLLSTIQFIHHFVEDQLLGEDAYWWAQFSTAVEFSKTLV